MHRSVEDEEEDATKGPVVVRRSVEEDEEDATKGPVVMQQRTMGKEEEEEGAVQETVEESSRMGEEEGENKTGCKEARPHEPSGGEWEGGMVVEGGVRNYRKAVHTRRGVVWMTTVQYSEGVFVNVMDNRHLRCAVQTRRFNNNCEVILDKNYFKSKSGSNGSD